MIIDIKVKKGCGEDVYKCIDGYKVKDDVLYYWDSIRTTGVPLKNVKKFEVF